MLLRIYKINHPVILLLIFILTGSVWSLSFIKAAGYEFPEYNFEMPLYLWIYSWISKYPLLATILSYILILIAAGIINRLNNRYFLLESRTYLPSLIYILLCSIYPLQNLHPILFSNLFLLICLNKIFSSYREENRWSNFFDAGILISLASLFYIKYAFFVVIIWFSLFILRPFRGREWLLSIIGFILPYVFVITYFFAFEENTQYKIGLFFNQLVNFKSTHNYNYIYFYNFHFLAREVWAFDRSCFSRLLYSCNTLYLFSACRCPYNCIFPSICSAFGSNSSYLCAGHTCFF